MVELTFYDYKEFRYKYTGEFHEGLAVVKNNENQFGFINKKGKEVIPCQYLMAKDFSEGLAAVKNEEGLWGYINEQGEEVIKCKYLAAADFSESLAVVATTLADYVYIEKNGMQHIGCSYEYASSFKEGYAVVRHKGSNLYRYLEKDGHHTGRYLSASNFFKGIAMIKDDENIYIITKEFEENVLKTMKQKDIKSIQICNNGMYRIQNISGKWGYLSKNFEEKIPFSFIMARDFNDGIAVVDLSEDWHGLITEEGIITAFSKLYQYQSIKSFHDGLSAVQNLQGLWGYINKEGKEVISCQFKQADNFSEGLAGVIGTDNAFHYIDKQGKKKITLNNIYYSSLELDDQVITIKADSPQELAAEKIRVLSIAKEDIIKSTINMIDQLAYTETSGLSGLYRQKQRRRKQVYNSKTINAEE